MIYPFRFTRKFNTKLRTLFYVPNFAKTTRSIQQQFKAGVARQIEQDIYEVWIRDIPSRVVMREATLISISYLGGQHERG